jgi:hypothetical protein
MKKRITKKLNLSKKIKKQTKKNKNHLLCKKSDKNQKKTKNDLTQKLSVVESNTVVAEVKPVKKRKKSSNKMYFTQDTEDAIELFNHTEDLNEREHIFETRIKYPFEKLVENVFNTFKFSYFETSPLDVQKETISHLVANISKFEKSKGKAFSFFSIVAKHYLIFLNNSNYKRFNASVEIGEEKEEHTVQLQSEDKHHKESEMSDFMRLMISYWEQNVSKIFTKPRDLNIANAVIELFRRSDRIDSFNKKALYLYIREISNCKTQQITKVINKMKMCHANLTKSYIDTGTILQTNKLF